MTKTIKKLFSTISVVLCASIGLSLPLEVLAASSQTEEHNYSSFDGVQGESDEIGNIITELTNKRTETSKEFLLDNGTKLVAEYNQPIHFKNSKGKWVGYNNSMKDTKSSDNDGEFESQSADVSVKLSKKAKKNNMIKLSAKDYDISWGYDGANMSTAENVKSDKKLSGNDKFTTLTNLTSETYYKDVFKNVDLQYFVSGGGVKENIIIKSKDVQNEFNILYKVNNLTAKQKDDYTISLYNKENKEVYTIAAPFMTDKKGISSTQLKLKITKQNGANLNVKLTADKEFINSNDRQFPIVIDPEITKKYYQNYYVDEVVNNAEQNHGPYYFNSNSYVMAKIYNLPQLEAGEQIISAKYNFEITNASTLFTSSEDDPIYFNAHLIKRIDNNIVITYDADVLDYDTLTYDDNTYFSFDLTKTFKDWYKTNGVKGFVVEALDSIGNRQVNLQGGTNASLTPSFTYTYKDFKGTASGMSSHEFSVGQNAKAYVSDYLGSLSVNQPLYEGTGSRMPASISTTYNSFTKEWNYSFNQRITAASSDMAQHGYDYIYTDSEGANHYLKKDTSENKWYDEDGLGIEMSLSDTEATIEAGNTQKYELPANGGWIKSEKDEHDNTITYSRTNDILTSIEDGAGRTIGVTQSNGVVTSLSLPGSKTVSLSYSNGKLTTVTFPDNRKSVFNYNNDGDIASIQQNDSISGSNRMNSKVGFNYTDGKVTKVTEYGSDNSQGNYLEIAYNTDNTTTFTDRQEREVTYTFDNEGNKISVLNANGYLESNSSNGFGVSTGADSFTKNYMLGISNFTKIDADRGELTSSGGTMSLDNTVSMFGDNSVKIENPVSNGHEAFYTSASHEFNTEFNGKAITLSAYVKTNNIEQIYSDESSIGACLKLRAYNSSNEMVAESNSIGVTGTSSWQRISTSINVPDNTAHVKVYLNLRYASGTAWFDCLQLEQGNTANDYNAIEFSDTWTKNDNTTVTPQNGSISIEGSAGIYNNAESEETEEPTEAATEEAVATTVVEVTETAPNDSVVTYDSYGNEIQSAQGFVNRTVRKTYELGNENTTEEVVETTTEESGTEPAGSGSASGDSLGNKYIYQRLNVNQKGITFNVVGEAQAKSVPLSNENRTFGIALNVYYDGEETPETHYQEFNAYTDSKQTVALAVTPYESEKTVNYVDFAFVYGYNKNTMTVTNAMLNISPIGFASGEQSNTESTEEASTSAENEDDNYVDYEVTSESVDTSKKHMSSSTAYDSNGNYVVSRTDEAGNTTQYTNDADGNVTEVVSPLGYSTEYTYDAAGNITKISSDEAENNYTYNGIGAVSTINHNNFNYTFNYNAYNNIVSSYVGNVALSTNTYAANNGNLTQTTYANGDYLKYYYDDYDNIVEIKGKGNNGDKTLATFVYNKKGLVSKVNDISSETTIYYTYDFSGNKIGEYRQKESGDLSYQIDYDSNGNKVEKTSVNGTTKTITTGVDDDGNSFVSNNGITVKTESDDFGRTEKAKVDTQANNQFLTEYEYANGTAANSTTNRISKITQRYDGVKLFDFGYTFDESGNIVSVSENGTDRYTYDYDELNQLHIVQDDVNRTITYYTYDNGGNITKVKTHNIDSNGALLSLVSEINYTYDTTWKDKLLSYDGQSITYDAMGNPTAYRDGMTLTWENGRWLKTITKNGTNIEMKYDINGLRTQKGNTHYYYDTANNLIAMVKGNDTLHFYYDSNNSPIAFTRNNTMYYYVKNIQGDIIKIVNEDGGLAYTYDYDAWGALLSIKDNQGHTISGNSLATTNPLRYRGYVYDDETGLYYLQSRYYDPKTGRFLNADVYFDTQTGSPLSTNMFAYCENNAIFSIDIFGKAHSSNNSVGAGSVIKSSNFNYRRNDAVKYAKKWAFKRNPQFYSYGNDCANFVSQCLFAGGIPMTITAKSSNDLWYSIIVKSYIIYNRDVSNNHRHVWSVSYSWSVVPTQYNYFKRHYSKTTYTIKDTKKSLQSVVLKIKIGDPLYFDDNGDGKPNHAAIVSGLNKKTKRLYYAGHSNSHSGKNIEEDYLTHKKGSKKKVYVVAMKDNN